MRRKTLDALLSTAGLVMAVVLVAAGALLLWGQSFASNQVHDQLAQQKVFFPTKAAIAAQHNPEITKYLTPYAGQQVLTGKQAEVFANHYIKVHLNEVAGGQTYSEVSGTFLTMKPTDANYQQVAQQRTTLFQGETLRGLLLNAYAFGTIASIALIAAWVSIAGAALLLLLAGLGFWHGRRISPDPQVLTTTSSYLKEPATTG